MIEYTEDYRGGYDEEAILVPPADCSTGYVPVDRSTHQYGSLPYSTTFDVDLIPEDEWKDRIDEIEESGTDLLTLSLSYGMEAKFQNGWGYCWSYGGVRMYEMLMIMAGLTYVPLSAFYCAYDIKGGANQGGNTFDIVPYLAEHGAPAESIAPNLEKRPSASKAEIKENAEHYKLIDWYEMQDNNFSQKMTALLLGMPVCAGYAHWGHMVCDLVPCYRESRGSIEYGVRGWNSWGTSWGPFGNGVYELWGRKANSFDQVTGVVPTIVGV